MLPDKKGHFNGFGGRFVPETLIYALDELEKEYKKARHDKKFIHGKNRFVLPVRIGKAVVREGIPESLIKKSVEMLYK